MYKLILKKGGKMGLKNIIGSSLNIDIEKAVNLWKNAYDTWNKVNGSYIYPNGLLGKLPVHISCFQYSHSNSVTGNKTFKGENLIDNIVLEPFSITLTLICFGREYFEMLENIKKLSESPKSFQDIIVLYYAKTKKVYGPLAITNFDFSDTSDTTNLQKISLKLKNVDIREFIDENGIISTATLNLNDYINEVHPDDNPMPLNLLDELKNTKQFKEIQKKAGELW